MLESTALVLAGGVKGFLENSAYVLGLPLVVLGVIGVLIALSPLEIRWPERQETQAAEAEVELAPGAEVEVAPGAEGHPTPVVYVQVGLILAVVTAVEVVAYYVDLAQGALLGILLALSGMKFAMVALWFMHLRFDSRLFSALFTGGLALVAALFFVVLATLGANLV